jgi:hypothetical protein
MLDISIFTPVNISLHIFANLIQGDQEVSVHLMNNPHTIDELKMVITIHSEFGL